MADFDLATTRHARIAEELLLRREARRDFLTYLKAMKESLHADFEHALELAPHQLIVVAELQMLADNPGAKLGISMPPGSAKSQIASIAFPTWLLARDPKTHLICVAATEGLSDNFARRRRNAMLTDQWCRISGVSLATDGRSLAHQITTKGGDIRSAGMGSTIVGLRSHMNIVDDPVSGIEEAFSPSRLDQQATWFDAELRSRLKPGGSEAIVMTRWSPRDLIGVMQDRLASMSEHWRFVRLPQECDEPENDVLGREMGELLWPDYYTDDQIKQAKANPLLWNGLHQQRPVVGSGDWCDVNDIEVVDKLPGGRLYGTALSCDLALEITAQNDWTVMLAAKIDAQLNIYVTDMYRRRATPDITSKAAVTLCSQHSPGLFLLDDDNAAKVWAVHAEEKARKAKVPMPVKRVKNQGKDKQARAAALRGHIHERRLHLLSAPWNSVLLDELNRFPHDVVYDDIVDALANISREIHSIAPAQSSMPEEHEVETAIIVGPPTMDEPQPLFLRQTAGVEEGQFRFIGEQPESGFGFQQQRIGQ